MLLEGQVRKVIESTKEDPKGLIRRLEREGFVVELSVGNLIQVVGFPDRFDSLRDKGINLIRDPYYSYGGPPGGGSGLFELPPESSVPYTRTPFNTQFSPKGIPGGSKFPGLGQPLRPPITPEPSSKFVPIGGSFDGGYMPPKPELQRDPNGPFKPYIPSGPSIDTKTFKTGGYPYNPQPGGAVFKPVISDSVDKTLVKQLGQSSNSGASSSPSGMGLI